MIGVSPDRRRQRPFSIRKVRTPFPSFLRTVTEESQTGVNSLFFSDINSEAILIHGLGTMCVTAPSLNLTEEKIATLEGHFVNE